MLQGSLVRVPQNPLEIVLGRPRSARWAVPLLIPVSSVISAQECPCARRSGALVGNLCHTGPMLQPADFVILRCEGQTPSLAMCQRCQIKFFASRELTHRGQEAREFLFGRFLDHKCQRPVTPSMAGLDRH